MDAAQFFLLVFWDFLLLHALRLFFFCCLTVASLSLFSCRTKITTEWIDDNTNPLQNQRLKTLIAKDVGNLWYNGKTGAYNWWVNAETKVFQYVEPKGDGVLVVKVPNNYFKNNDNPDEPTEESCSNGKKNWKNARKKILASMRMGKGNLAKAMEGAGEVVEEEKAEVYDAEVADVGAAE